MEDFSRADKPVAVRHSRSTDGILQPLPRHALAQRTSVRDAELHMYMLLQHGKHSHGRRVIRDVTRLGDFFSLTVFAIGLARCSAGAASRVSSPMI